MTLSTTKWGQSSYLQRDHYNKHHHIMMSTLTRGTTSQAHWQVGPLDKHSDKGDHMASTQTRGTTWRALRQGGPLDENSRQGGPHDENSDTWQAIRQGGPLDKRADKRDHLTSNHTRGTTWRKTTKMSNFSCPILFCPMFVMSTTKMSKTHLSNVMSNCLDTSVRPSFS